MQTLNKAHQLTDLEKVRKITKLIRYGEKRLKRKFSFLENQNTIGLCIFSFSILGMLLTSYFYIQGLLNVWVTIFINAVLASFLHELEHDLIHGLYFKDTWIEKLMMWGVWIFRGNTPNPFYRKKIHLHHHKFSGQFSDIEEQMIGNGMKYNFLRFLVMLDQQLSFLINVNRVSKTSPELNKKEMFRSGFPILVIFYTMLYTFLIGNLLFIINNLFNFISIPDYFLKALNYINILAIVYLIPNFIRQASLQFISSTMHYFGDIDPSKAGLLQQTQVLNKWYFIPFHLFCFNFGSTHGIHHFVVNQPFYLRQMIAPIAHKAMKKYGVRFNDLGTFKRANRFQLT